MKIFINLIFLFTLCIIVISCKTESGYLKIQEASLKDSVVKSEIVKLINGRIKTDSTFSKGYGYVTVDFYALHKRDTLAHYLITPSVYKHDMDSHFPPYYTFINKKPVLIYDLDLTEHLETKYTSSSKKKIIKLTEKFIDPLETKEDEKGAKEFVKAYEEQFGVKGNWRNMKSNASYMGASTEIYLLRDGKYIINYNVNP